MSKEILRQLAKSTDYPDCEVYFLEVQQSGIYPVLGYGDKVIGYVQLERGDIWKVGFTSKGEKNRYPANTYYKSKDLTILLTKRELLYQTMYEGTYKEMIILEKILIYSYPLWAGKPELLKPPGCKIFR